MLHGFEKLACSRRSVGEHQYERYEREISEPLFFFYLLSRRFRSAPQSTERLAIAREGADENAY